MWLLKLGIVNPNWISKMDPLLEESQETKVKEFIVWIKFQNLTFHNARIVIRSMNVHLLKIMWGKDLLNISKIWI